MGQAPTTDPTVGTHSLRQSHNNQPSHDSNMLGSRLGAETALPLQYQRQLSGPKGPDGMGSRHSRSPSNTPLESKYGRQRQDELLAQEEERRRSRSRGHPRSNEDSQSCHSSYQKYHRSSCGGHRSGSYSVSVERAYQAPLAGLGGARNAEASQMNTGSWRAAVTPSLAGSGLSSKVGPPMHVHELQSQASALKRKTEQSPGKNQLHLLQSTMASKDHPYEYNDSDQHAKRAKNLEPQAYPGAGAYGDGYGRAAQAFQQQMESQSVATLTRNNLDPQTLQSSTDSFNQMQSDIMRLQAKIRGLESRLNPDGPISSIPLQPQAMNMDYTPPSHGQASYAAQPYERGGRDGGKQQQLINGMAEPGAAGNMGMDERSNGEQPSQHGHQRPQEEMRIVDAALGAAVGQMPVHPAMSHQKRQQFQGRQTAQPGQISASGTVSPSSPPGNANNGRAECNLPLQQPAPEEGRGTAQGRPQTQQSMYQQSNQQSNAASLHQTALGAAGPTDLTTFGGEQCQFSNSQIFHRSGNAQGRRQGQSMQGETPDHGAQDPEMPPEDNAQASPYPNLPMQHATGLTKQSSMKQQPQQQSNPYEYYDSSTKPTVQRADQAFQHQVTAPGADLVNISSLTQTLMEQEQRSCLNHSLNQNDNQDYPAGEGASRAGQSRGRASRGARGKEPGVPMTSRSHSRSVTTGHRGNMKMTGSKVRTHRGHRSKHKLDARSANDRPRKVSRREGGHPVNKPHGLLPGPVRQRSRNRNLEDGARLSADRSEEDQASFRTHNLGKSSHRSHKTQKSAKSLKPRRHHDFRVDRGHSQSHRKQYSRCRTGQTFQYHMDMHRARLQQAQSQGSRMHSRTSKMSRCSEYRAKRRQSTARKRGQCTMSGKANSYSDDNSCSRFNQDGGSEHQHVEKRRIVKENRKLRQKLRVQEEANAELRQDIERLREKLVYMDELHRKTQKAKIQYGKVLAQLESSEMIRREQQDKIKDLVNKVHKLKKQKRELLERQYKHLEKSGRWDSIKQESTKQVAAAVASLKLKGEKKGKANGSRTQLNTGKQTERTAREAKKKAGRSQPNGLKKHYDTFQSSSTVQIGPEELGAISREATNQLIQIQSLHHGLSNHHSKSNSRSRKSGKKAGQIVSGRLYAEGVEVGLHQNEQQQVLADADRRGAQFRSGGLPGNPGGQLGRSPGQVTPASMPVTIASSLLQPILRSQANDHNFSRPQVHGSALGQGAKPPESCFALSANQPRHLGRADTGEAMNLAVNGQQAQDGAQAKGLGAADMLRMHPNGSGEQVPPGQGGRGGSRTPEESANSFGNSLRQPGILGNNDNFSAGNNHLSRKAMVPFQGGEDAAARIQLYRAHDPIDIKDQACETADQQADDLYMRYRRLKDLERTYEERSNSFTRQNNAKSAALVHQQLTGQQLSSHDKNMSASNQSNRDVAFNVSSHKCIEDYHAQALRGSRGSQNGARAAPDGGEVQPDTIVNIPIMTAHSRAQAQELMQGPPSGRNELGRAAAADSPVRIEDMFSFKNQRAYEGPMGLNHFVDGAPGDSRHYQTQTTGKSQIQMQGDRQTPSRNASKSAAVSKDERSSGFCASELRHLRASMGSIRHNVLSKDTIGSLGGYARQRETSKNGPKDYLPTDYPHGSLYGGHGSGEHTFNAINVFQDVQDYAAAAGLQPRARGTDLKDQRARVSRLQGRSIEQSAEAARKASSPGVLSDDTEKISRRYLNLTSQDQPSQDQLPEMLNTDY